MKKIKSDLHGTDLQENANISDMFESAMLFTISPLGAGHKARKSHYWENEGNRNKEAFAEMFSATVSNPASLEQIKNIFLNLMQCF